jgi:hypothetical protein
MVVFYFLYIDTRVGWEKRRYLKFLSFLGDFLTFISGLCNGIALLFGNFGAEPLWY